METKKILIISDSPTTKSGFGVHGYWVASILSQEHEVAYQGLQHHSRDIMTGEYGTTFEIYPNKDLETGQQLFGQTNLAEIVMEFKPDVVLTLLDYHMIQHVANVKYPKFQITPFTKKKLVDLDTIYKLVQEQYEKTLADWKIFEWHAALPIDGEPIPYFWFDKIDEIDQIITFSRYGRQLLQQYGIESITIPHGVDTTIFKPDPDLKTDFFLVTNINRNQHRKQIPRTIEAYRLFIDSEGLKPHETKLLLHMWKSDPMGWDLEFLIKTYNLEQYVLLPPKNPLVEPLNERQLADLYNASHVFFSTTGGEGFGLTTLEALACGVPVVITDYTTSRELIGNNERGRLIKVATFYWDTPERCGNMRALVDVKDAAKQLSLMYHARERDYEKMSKNARKFAEQHDWKVVGKKWLKLYR